MPTINNTILRIPEHLSEKDISIEFIKSLANKIDTYSGKSVLIIGDVMLDQYLIGDVERISPEAPVPVVLIEKETVFVGGAGNVARNITSLGGNAILVGVAGCDNSAKSVEDCLTAEKVFPYIIKSSKLTTTVKTRVMARRQQIVRIDKEGDHKISSAIAKEVLSKIERVLDNVGAVVVSDYGKGLICEKVISPLMHLLEQRDIPVLVDPKPQNKILYKGVTLLTPNAKETKELSHLPVKTKEEVVLAGKKLKEDLECPCLVTTLGADGMAVFLEDKSIWHIGTIAKHVYDVTGAGDTVIGVTALGLASGLPLLEACIVATFAAGLVVSEVGAATVSPQNLIEAIQSYEAVDIRRWE